MIQFFAPDIAENPILPESDSQHAIRVLRLGVGDRVQVVDGKGNVYDCIIAEPHQKRTLLSIVDSRPQLPHWPFNITIAVAPTKHLDRMEWLIEKMVEIGFNRFVPLLCRHSERKELKIERLQKIAVSAMKQSLKATLPTIEPMTPISQFIKEQSAIESQKFVCYCSDEITERLVLAEQLQPLRDTTVLIGPEGDFSPEEISATLDSGFKAVTLGDTRLRTETAALYSLSTIHVVNQLSR